MVATSNGKSQAQVRNELEGIPQDDQQEQEAVQKEPTYWKQAAPVRINTITLTPDMLKEDIYYRSTPTKYNPQGLVTILDSNYVRYRIGFLLASLEEEIQEMAKEGTLNEFVLDSIGFYHEYVAEKEQIRREQQKGVILEKAERYYDRFKGLLVAANKQMKSWTKEQMVEWIAENMEL